jgi:hypothetical protein
VEVLMENWLHNCAMASSHAWMVTRSCNIEVVMQQDWSPEGGGGGHGSCSCCGENPVVGELV